MPACTAVEAQSPAIVIPAAGIGARAGGDRPKQYQCLGNDLLIDVTIDRLAWALPDAPVMVALGADDGWWPLTRSAAARHVRTCIGGASRADSVLAGLRALALPPDRRVLVHDAARPCITPSDIHALLAAAGNDQSGGLLAQSITDTVKEVDAGGYVVATRERSRLWRAQTPQLFPGGVLERALLSANAAGASVTDEASAVEHLGCQPLVVPGRADNIKVTQPEDLAMAAWFIEQQRATEGAGR
ncbi:2-C-methyl-D-erythritol 4-phosphate cytidylyltransferase [Halomonadaceae bacterium KBTZ08]